VKIITRDNMIKGNVKGVLLAPLSLIGGGGIRVQTSKEQLLGVDFTTASGAVVDNPFYYGSAFSKDLQQLTDAYVSTSDSLKNKFFIKSIYVTGGSTRLVYEEFNGEKSNDYRLSVTLYVYKDYENQKTIFDTLEVLQDAVKGKGTPTMEVVDCGYLSDTPYPLGKWQEGNAALLKTELSKVSDACKRKFSDQLATLLLK
jgi:hypothetical protein